MNNMYFYQTSIGEIGIAEKNGNITNLYFANEQAPRDKNIFETDTLKTAARQLQEYLAGKLKRFNLPLTFDGTDFMLRVWKSLLNIPYGETRSYREIAHSVGNIRASRAVGHACSRNPIPIIIPCHRVIGSNGRLTGFGGGLDVKAYLLELERKG